MYISSFFNEVTGVANESAPFQGWRSVMWQRCVSSVRKVGFVFCFGMRARAWEWVCLWAVKRSRPLVCFSKVLNGVSFSSSHHTLSGHEEHTAVELAEAFGAGGE